MHFFLLSRVLKWKNFLSEIVGDYREYHRKVFELSFFPGNQSCKVGGRRSQRESSFEPFGGKGPTVYWTGQLETPASENQQRLIIKWEERERDRFEWGHSRHFGGDFCTRQLRVSSSTPEAKSGSGRRERDQKGNIYRKGRMLDPEELRNLT